MKAAPLIEPDGPPTAEAILAEAVRSGVKLSLANGRLVSTGRGSAMTAAFGTKVAAAKPALIALLDRRRRREMWSDTSTRLESVNVPREVLERLRPELLLATETARAEVERLPNEGTMETFSTATFDLY